MSKPAPKKSGYALFSQACREEQKKNHPEEKIILTEFSKSCGERWKVCSDKDKKRFHDMAERDKKRFEDEMKSYAPNGAAGGKKAKRVKRTKDPNAPKRALSGFFLFCGEERPRIRQNNPEFKVGDVAKACGKLWGEATPEIKKKFELLGQREKARYTAAMAAYNKTGKPQPIPIEEEEESEEGSYEEESE